jgi:hypothetical protein
MVLIIIIITGIIVVIIVLELWPIGLEMLTLTLVVGWVICSQWVKRGT